MVEIVYLRADPSTVVQALCCQRKAPLQIHNRPSIGRRWRQAIRILQVKRDVLTSCLRVSDSASRRLMYTTHYFIPNMRPPFEPSVGSGLWRFSSTGRRCLVFFPVISSHRVFVIVNAKIAKETNFILKVQANLLKEWMCPGREGVSFRGHHITFVSNVNVATWFRLGKPYLLTLHSSLSQLCSSPKLSLRSPYVGILPTLIILNPI